MEFAFEGGRGLFGSSEFTSKQVEKLDAFYEKYPDDTKRLRAILKNVIKNKEKFVV